MNIPELSEHDVIEFGFGGGQDYFVTERFDEVQHRWIQERYEKQLEQYELVSRTTINPYADQLRQEARDRRCVR